MLGCTEGKWDQKQSRAPLPAASRSAARVLHKNRPDLPDMRKQVGEDALFLLEVGFGFRKDGNMKT